MKLLYLTPRPVWPANRGGNQRSNLLFRALRQFADVDMVLLQREPLSDDEYCAHRDSFGLVGQWSLPRRGQRGLWRFVYPLAPGPVNRIAHNFGDHNVHYDAARDLLGRLTSLHENRHYDAVVGRYLMPTAVAGGLRLPIPRFVDIDDVDTQKYVSRLARPGVSAFEKRMVQWHIDRFERVVPAVAEAADHLWVAASDDVEAIPHRSVSVLNNIPFVDDDKPAKCSVDAADSNTIVALTSMNFPVNERAIDRFVFHVWPRIIAQAPDARFIVAGSKMTDSQISRWSKIEGVTALGYVENLDEFYRKSAFTVVPIFEGGGTKIKVLESLLHGKTTVVAEHSVRGYDHVLHDQDALLIARSEDALVDRCLRLLSDKSLRTRLANRGRDLIETHFSFRSFADRVRTDVNRILQTNAGCS